MEKMEFFDSKEKMNEYFEKAKERARQEKESFKEKYADKVNCDALFEDIRSMYLKEKSAKAIFSLAEREEYRAISENDFYGIIGTIIFELSQLPRERNEYTYKKDSDPEMVEDFEPDQK